MRAGLLFFLLLFCGCQTVYYEVEKGYVSDSLTTNRWGGPLEAMVSTFHIVGEDKFWGPFNYSLGIGPAVVVPTDGNAAALGFDESSKIIFVLWPVQPYFEFGLGFLNTTERWEGQGTNWGFIVQGGVGVRYQLTGTGRIGLSYKQWHESNGATIFGSPGPNPGFEGGSLWLSYTFEF